MQISSVLLFCAEAAAALWGAQAVLLQQPVQFCPLIAVRLYYTELVVKLSLCLHDRPTPPAKSSSLFSIIGRKRYS